MEYLQLPSHVGRHRCAVCEQFVSALYCVELFNFRRPDGIHWVAILAAASKVLQAKLEARRFSNQKSYVCFDHFDRFQFTGIPSEHRYPILTPAAVPEPFHPEFFFRNRHAQGIQYSSRQHSFNNDSTDTVVAVRLTAKETDVQFLTETFRSGLDGHHQLGASSLIKQVIAKRKRKKIDPSATSQMHLAAHHWQQNISKPLTIFPPSINTQYRNGWSYGVEMNAQQNYKSSLKHQVLPRKNLLWQANEKCSEFMWSNISMNQQLMENSLKQEPARIQTIRMTGDCTHAKKIKLEIEETRPE